MFNFGFKTNTRTAAVKQDAYAGQIVLTLEPVTESDGGTKRTRMVFNPSALAELGIGESDAATHFCVVHNAVMPGQVAQEGQMPKGEHSYWIYLAGDGAGLSEEYTANRIRIAKGTGSINNQGFYNALVERYNLDTNVANTFELVSEEREIAPGVDVTLYQFVPVTAGTEEQQEEDNSMEEVLDTPQGDELSL